MAVLQKLQQLLGGVSSAIGNVKQAEGALRARLTEIEQEEHRLLTLPAPPADVEKSLAALLAEVAQRWVNDNGRAVVTAASGRVARAIGPADARPADQLRSGYLADALAAPLTLGALAAIAPEVVREGLARVVRATTYDHGPALGGRIERLAALDAERVALQREHADLVDRAVDAGVDLRHLPEETARRMRAAEARAGWDRDGEANADFYRRHPSARPPEPAS